MIIATSSNMKHDNILQSSWGEGIFTKAIDGGGEGGGAGSL